MDNRAQQRGSDVTSLIDKPEVTAIDYLQDVNLQVGILKQSAVMEPFNAFNVSGNRAAIGQAITWDNLRSFTFSNLFDNQHQGTDVERYLSNLQYISNNRYQAVKTRDQVRSFEMIQLTEVGYFCNVTAFPTVAYVPKKAVAETEAVVIPIGVMYSSFEMAPSQEGPLYDVSPTQYKEFVCDDGTKVNVDLQYFGSGSSIRASVAASLNSFRPLEGSYLTIFPLVKSDFFRNWDLTYGWSIQGSSLGLAIAAAIRGCPTMMYTGYFSQMGTSSDAVYRYDPYAPKADGYSDNWQDVNLGRPLVLASNARSGLRAGTRIANTVEYVQDIGVKAAFAFIHGLPLIMPYYSESRQDVQKILESQRISQPRYQGQYFMSQGFYTPELALDGVDYFQSITPVLLANDPYAVTVMASYAYMAYVNKDMFLNRDFLRYDQDKTFMSNMRQTVQSRVDRQIEIKENRKKAKQPATIRRKNEEFADKMNQKAKKAAANENSYVQATKLGRAAFKDQKQAEAFGRKAQKVADWGLDLSKKEIKNLPGPAQRVLMINNDYAKPSATSEAVKELRQNPALRNTISEIGKSFTAKKLRETDPQQLEAELQNRLGNNYNTFKQLIKPSDYSKISVRIRDALKDPKTYPQNISQVTRLTRNTYQGPSAQQTQQSQGSQQPRQQQQMNQSANQSQTARRTAPAQQQATRTPERQNDDDEDDQFLTFDPAEIGTAEAQERQ